MLQTPASLVRAFVVVVTSCIVVRASTSAPAAPSGQTWFVDDDACPGPGSGTREQPFCKIQRAIEAASDGDLVLVRPGNYPERIDFRGKAISVVAVAGPTQTTLAVVPGTNSVGAIFQNGEGPDSVLDGFTIRGNGFRGAVLCVGGSPTIVRNVIEQNSGRGIECIGSTDVRILSNVIRANSTIFVGWGSGIYAEDSTLLIDGNVILQNYLHFFQGFGSGIALDGCTATLAANVIAENTIGFHTGAGDNRGAGLFAANSDVTLIGNTFSRNLTEAVEFGPGLGGAISSLSSQLRISGTILWNDDAQATTTGDEFWIWSGSVQLDDSDVQGGAAKISLNGGATLLGGTGNLDTDPLFVASSTSDYHLQPTSPLVDVGPLSLTGGTDVDGEPRALDGNGDRVQRADIGADERDETTLSMAGATTVGGVVTFTTLGPSGRFYALAASDQPGDVAVPPFGSLLLGLAGFQVVATGAVPGDDALSIPPVNALVGLTFWFQAVSIDLTTHVGSTSRVLSLTIH